MEFASTQTLGRKCFFLSFYILSCCPASPSWAEAKAQTWCCDVVLSPSHLGSTSLQGLSQNQSNEGKEMQSRKGRGFISGSGMRNWSGRAEGKLRRVSCFLSSSPTEAPRTLKNFPRILQQEVTELGFKPKPLAISSQELIVCSKAIPESHLLRKLYIESFISELGDNGVWGLILSGLASTKGIEARAGRSKEC